ncbi:MAG: HTH domain-containing protein [Micrococcaceae bacterium]
MPAYVKPAGAKLEKAKAVEKSKVQLDKTKKHYDKARDAFDKAFMEALEYGVTKAELARRMSVSEATVYQRIKRIKCNRK